MVYQVSYGKDKFLRQGRIDSRPTTYFHPSTVNSAIKNFERRFPAWANIGSIQCIERGKVVRVCREVL